MASSGLEPATLTINGDSSYYVATFTYLTPSGQIRQETGGDTHDLPVTINTVKNSIVRIATAVGGGMLKLTGEQGCIKTSGIAPWYIVCTEAVASVTVYDDD